MISETEFKDFLRFVDNIACYVEATVGSGGRLESHEKPDWCLIHKGRAGSSESQLCMLRKKIKELQDAY